MISIITNISMKYLSKSYIKTKNVDFRPLVHHEGADFFQSNFSSTIRWVNTASLATFLAITSDFKFGHIMGWTLSTLVAFYRVITLFLPGISDLGQRQVKFPYPWKITLFSALHLHTPLTLWDIPTTYSIVTEITNEDMNNSTTIWIAGSSIIIVSQKVYI